PLAVALPDNIFVGPRPALSQLFGSPTNVVAIVEISAAEAARRGATGVLDGTREGSLYRISRIPDKGAKAATFYTRGAESAYTAVGRFVFLPSALQAIDVVEQRIPSGAELDDIPLMQLLLARGE